jgi:hypothetical protein
MIPTSPSNNVYGVRVAHNPTSDTFDVARYDDSLCKVNPLYYHRIYHSAGTNASNVKMYYQEGTDGYWSDIAHWNTPEWHYTTKATASTASGFSTVEIKNWNNYSPSPFALAAKTFYVDAGEDKYIYEGEVTTLMPYISINNPNGINWTPDAYLDNPNIKTPKASPPKDTTYTLAVTNKSGCIVKDSVRVLLQPDVLLVPTGFSPNGDGNNDKLYPLNKNIEKVRFQVYNRWGEQVFLTEQVGEGWDGTYKGVLQDIGTFVWQAEYKMIKGTKVLSATGNTTLIK